MKKKKKSVGELLMGSFFYVSHYAQMAVLSCTKFACSCGAVNELLHSSTTTNTQAALEFSLFKHSNKSKISFTSQNSPEKP